MRLHYWRRPGVRQNFGDALNPWMWPRLLPEMFDREDDGLFLGIGTLLNREVPDAPAYVVMGSGAGYGPPPRLDDRWHVHAVRGPLTARRLGLSEELAITDPGVLVPRLWAFAPTSDRSEEPGPAFMPHWRSRSPWWSDICRRSGLRFVDPLADVERVVEQIGSATVLVTEAMHGAVVADALRVPWIPVRLDNPDRSIFKWRDWCASMELEHREIFLPSPWRHGEPRGVPGIHLRSVVRRLSSPLRRRSIARHLTRAVQGGPRHLSREDVLRDRTERLIERVETLKRRFPQ